MPNQTHHPFSPSVLVVDDHQDSAATLASLLPLIVDCTAHVAFSGLHALAVGDSIRPQVVILDISMPGMDGCETARRMRARPWGLHARVITVSGWGDDERGCCGSTAAVDVRLTKPVSLEALIDALTLCGASAP